MYAIMSMHFYKINKLIKAAHVTAYIDIPDNGSQNPRSISY